MSRHILTKLTKTKQKEIILETIKKNQWITYKGNPIHLTADLSAETLQARREWHDIFKVVKGKNLQQNLQYGKDPIQNWWRNEKLFRKTVINEKEMKETRVKINKTKNWFFERINEINKPLVRLLKEKREESNQQN